MTSPILAAVLLSGASGSLLPPGGRHIAHRVVLAPSPAMNEQHCKLATLLDAELERGLEKFAQKQVKLGNAENSMAVYVQAPMVAKAEALEAWSKLVLDNLAQIPDDAESVTLVVAPGSAPTTVTLDCAKNGSPREQALRASEMAAKLRRQQGKVDRLRAQNTMVETTLRRWQKRVRVAAARGEEAQLDALRLKLLASSKDLGLRSCTLADFDAATDDLGI